MKNPGKRSKIKVINFVRVNFTSQPIESYFIVKSQYAFRFLIALYDVQACIIVSHVREQLQSKAYYDPTMCLACFQVRFANYHKISSGNMQRVIESKLTSYSVTALS